MPKQTWLRVYPSKRGISTRRRLLQPASLKRLVLLEQNTDGIGHSCKGMGLKRMKIIFLDIDGVLNCKQTPNPRKFPFIVDSRLLRRLDRLLGLTGAQVVLSSNWRFDPAGIFSAKHYGIPFIASLPDLPGQPRCNPITEWLRGHPDVERFIVIDDEDDELDALPLFQPLRSTGLTDEIVEAAAGYLNGKTDKDMRRNKLVRIFQDLSAVVVGHKG